MNAKSLIVLAVVAVAAAAAALTVHQSSRPDALEVDGGYLFPELRNQVNDVDRIVIRSGEEELTVERRDEAWVDPASDGYPVKFETVKQLLMSASGLEVHEAKTKNPDLFDRLGVQDPGAEDSKSKLVEFYVGSGDPLAAVIVGDQKFGAQPLVYVRKDGENQAWACKGRFAVDTSPYQWFERQIVQLEKAKVREVVIEHPDGEALRLHREEDPGAFELDGVPEGRELTTPTAAEPIGSALGWLSFEKVRSADQVPFTPETTTVATFRCFDGLEVRVESVEHEDAVWARFTAALGELPEAAVEEPAGADGEAAAAEPAEGDAAAAESGEGDAAAAEAAEGGDAAGHEGHDHESEPAEAEQDQVPDIATQADVDEHNAKWSGWAFSLQAFKADQLRKRMEDLLKPVEEQPPIEEPAHPGDGSDGGAEGG